MTGVGKSMNNIFFKIKCNSFIRPTKCKQKDMTYSNIA